jgi:hypothetical protein
VKPNMEKYRKESDLLKQIVSFYDPDFEAQGLDEVNLDVTEYL